MITKEIVRQLIYEAKDLEFFVDRDIYAEIEKLIEVRHIILIQGIRRSGKSTLMRILEKELSSKYGKKNVLHINFEDNRLLNLEIKDLDKIYEYFLEINQPQGRIFLLFDEIQNIEKWEKWLNSIYERQHDKVKFFITGSNSSLTRSKYATSLTGRNLTISIYPFSFKEYLRSKSINIKTIRNIYNNRVTIKSELENYLHSGGFPEIALMQDKEIKRQLLQSYFSDIIHRDVLFKHDIKDVFYFEGLVKYLITNIGNLFSYNKLHKTFEYSISTIINYISYLRECFMIDIISYYDFSLKKQEKTNKKIYCIDNGLRNALSFKFSGDMGRLAENLVFIELKRRGNDIYYWNGANEVDFVFKNKDDSLTAINITYSDEINEREFKGLKEFKNKFKSKVKEIILITLDYEDKKDGIRLIPLWKWLLEQ